MSDHGKVEEGERWWLWERTDWPERTGHFINDSQLVADHSNDPDQKFTEYVPASALDRSEQRVRAAEKERDQAEAALEQETPGCRPT